MNDPSVSAPSVDFSSESKKEPLPPWFGFAAPHIRVTPGMKHDMESIRESIGLGIAAEMAERERANLPSPLLSEKANGMI